MAVKDYCVYKERRERLGKMLGENGIIFVPGAKTIKRNSDTEYPFRQESSFLHLTGFLEPDALLIVTGGENPRSILFCNPKDEEREIWTGKRFGPEGVKEEFGMEEAFANTETKKVAKAIRSALRNKQVIYYPEHREIGSMLRRKINAYLKRSREGKKRLALDGDRLLGEMRLIKDDIEVVHMVSAANRSAETYRWVLPLVRPGMTEIELEAEFTYRFRKMGGDPCHAYPPIVATGASACTLHHVSTNAHIKDGDLVLVDAGCEHEGYASDITRTFPANGRFTPEQRAIYTIVLAAQKAAIEEAKPDRPLSAVHDKAAFVICEGLIALGLLGKMDPLEAVKANAHQPFFPHGTSHWLGLDVHDVGDYIKSAGNKKQRILKPGMVITVEPGVYIQPNMQGIEKKWLGIGVRIEDDVLITTSGNTVLSQFAPKEIDEIEELIRPKAPRSARV